ncbi:hypothetical protein [Paenibacillus sp. BC26]|uniref:hypothetical protein n=1 Tax=Paenibacillus sp. BC26 TaxID=1881032 RepID=UPI000B878061|nr:hypothetical protein [Paenibacillus sp. BC26]
MMNMKKKRVNLILSLTLTFILLLSTVVWTVQKNEWDLFRNTEGFIEDQNSRLTQIPTEKENKVVVNSTDPVAREENELVTLNPLEKQKIEKKILTLNINGISKEIEFDISIINNKPILLNNNDRGYVLVS